MLTDAGAGGHRGERQTPAARSRTCSRWAGGDDLIALAAEVALGRLPPGAPAFTRRAVFVCPQHPLGVDVVGVEGLEALDALPGVVAVVPVATTGSSTAPPATTMVAAVMGVVATPEEAVALHREITAAVRCTYRPVDLPPHYLRTPGDVGTSASPRPRGASPR